MKQRHNNYPHLY